MSDPQHKIRLWLQGELDRRGHGAKGQLAAHLNTRPDAITRMTNTDPKKESREIRAHELLMMQDFFGSGGGGTPAKSVTDPAEIRSLLERIGGLRPENVSALVSMIQGLQHVNATQSSETQPGDQPGPDTSRLSRDHVSR